jgi:hypothetical protein
MKVISFLKGFEDRTLGLPQAETIASFSEKNVHRRRKSGSSIDSVLYGSTESSHPKHETKPLGTVFIPCVKDISENCKRIENRYNIRTVFKTKHALMEFTHENQTGKDSATEGVLCL